MDETNRERINGMKIGIMGCGHLGQAIAQSLLRHGLEKKNLLISLRGNPQTRQKIEALGMASCLASNRRLFQESGIVFITIRPQDMLELKEDFEPGRALVVSCMAGVSIELLSRVFGMKVHRMMFSGPDTILNGQGVAAMYPEHEMVKSLLRAMELTYIQTMSENDLNTFTAGVCMPAALLKTDHPAQNKQAIERIGKEYPLLLALFAWASKALPCFDNGADKEAYINRMITKGGVTDAIVKSLAGGAPLDTALREGIARIREIAMEIQRSVINCA